MIDLSELSLFISDAVNTISVNAASKLSKQLTIGKVTAYRVVNTIRIDFIPNKPNNIHNS